MPVLQNKAGAVKSVSDEAQARALVQSGEWAFADAADADSVATVDVATGLPERTATADYDMDVAAGHRQVVPEAATAQLGRTTGEYVDEKYSGLQQNLTGAVEGAASVLTMSASDWALDQLGADTAMRAEHTAGRKIGEAAAVVATMLSPFGKGSLAKALTASPAGAVSKFGLGGKTALARIAHTAGEGTAYSIAQASTNLALAEPGVAAESWAAELGQGALLGLALGAGGGLLGEGVRAVGSARAARATKAFNLDDGPGKEVIHAMAKAQNSMDDVLAVAAGQHADTVKAAAQRLSGARSSMLANDVAEVGEALASMRAAAGDAVTGPAKAKFTIAEGLAAKAAKTGKEVDQLAFLQYVEKSARKSGAPELADRVAQKLADNAAAAVKADEHLAGMAVTFPKAKYDKIFDLMPGEKLGPDAFKRLIKLGEKDPKELVKRAKMLTELHEGAKAATKGNEVASARIAEALAGYEDALSKLVPGETAKMLDDNKVLGLILGADIGAELLPEGTPGKNLLRLAAAYKLVGGIGKLTGAKSGLKRIINSIGRRASAGAAAGLAKEMPFVQRMGSMGSTAAMGASASAGYEFYNWAQRTFAGGAKAAMSAEQRASSAVAASVERVAKGTPKRARVMPTSTLVLDKLLGETESSKKTPQEKFKVIQERLSKYAVAPDAVDESMYHVLQPVAQISEQLADLMEGTLSKQLAYLQSIMPQDPGTMMMFGKSMWQPTDRELYEFSMGAMGVLMPLDTVDLIADGLVPPQAAEALAATNPEIFTKMQMSIIERADEVRANSTYNQRISLGLAFQLPLDPTTDPRYVAFQQSMHAQKTMDQAAGDSGEGSTPEESYSDAQKLLS